MAWAACERLDGRWVNAPTSWNFLHALAGMGSEKATPYGSPPVEFYKSFPFHAKMAFIDWPIAYVYQLRQPKPVCLKELQYP